MYQQRNSTRRRKFKVRSYSINPWGIAILIAKIVNYVVVFGMPLIAWEILAAVCPELIASVEKCKFYIMLIFYGGLAGAFVTYPSQFILRGEPWNEKIFIRRTSYHEDNDYDDIRNWPTK